MDAAPRRPHPRIPSCNNDPELVSLRMKRTDMTRVSVCCHCGVLLPQLQPLCRVAVGDGDEPPSLPRRVEVARPLARDPRRRPRPVEGPAGAARDDHGRGQVDELIVLHLKLRWCSFVWNDHFFRNEMRKGDPFLSPLVHSLLPPYLQYRLLLSARLQVALLAVHSFPLFRSVVV